LNGGAISWSSHKQPMIALSTTEAKYMAMSQATRKAMWLRSILDELGFTQENRTIIFVDGQGYLSLISQSFYN
jgi:hypothetical protein